MKLSKFDLYLSLDLIPISIRNHRVKEILLIVEHIGKPLMLFLHEEAWRMSDNNIMVVPHCSLISL